MAQGYTVDLKKDIYIDSETALNNMDRPALMDLLNRCKEDRDVGAVVVYDVSRLARDRIDFALIKQALRKVGITLLSATEPINDTPEGQMLEGVLSTVAEFFSKQSGRKVEAAMRHKAQTGGWPNLAPYGYINRKEKLLDGRIRAWIEPRPEEERWVQRAFKLFSSGQHSVKVLTKILNSEGFRVRHVRNRMTTVLHHSQLERLLRNKIYIGVVQWGGVINENGNHKPLIDPDLFYRVQDMLLMRSGSTTRVRRYRTLFKGISFCGECGSAMTIDVKEVGPIHSIRYLRCRKIQQGKSLSCSQRYFDEQTYIEQLERCLARIELPPSTVDILRERLNKVSGEENYVYEKLRTSLLREREAVERRQQRLLVRSLEDDPHDATARVLYERVRSELTQEHSRLTGEISRLKIRLDKIVQILKMALEIAGSCSRAFLAAKDPDYRGLLAQVIFKHLAFKDGELADLLLTDPFRLFHRWTGEKALKSLSDLALSCAHNRALVDGCKKRPGQHTSLSTIRRDLFQVEKSLDPKLAADIESCYLELYGRGLLRSSPLHFNNDSS